VARVLAGQQGLSLRQAYRYVEEARGQTTAQPVPPPTVVFTVKLPVPVVAALRAQARHCRRPLSVLVGEALQQWLAVQDHGG
jgi:hypothetical protein